MYVKKFASIISSVMLVVSPFAIAGGPTAPEHVPAASMPAFNFFMPQQSLLQHQHPIDKNHIDQNTHPSLHYVTLYPGSLRNNLVRIARAYGWKHIIWNSAEDYHWIGKIRVAANNLPDILKKLLEEYPLQADFYEGNHVLVIKPRTLQA